LEVTFAGLFAGYIGKSLLTLHWQVSFMKVTLAGLFMKVTSATYMGKLHWQVSFMKVTLAGLFESYICRSLL